MPLELGRSNEILGLRFEDILASERMSEKSFMNMRTLTRQAVRSLPYLMISDSKDYPGVASKVSVASYPNPSRNFNTKLVQSLEAAWGKASLDTGTKKIWSATSFIATLETDIESSIGISTVLNIEPK